MCTNMFIGQTFISLSGYILQRNGVDGLYYCEYNCDYKTAKHSDMRRHIESKHEVSEGYSCSICGFHTPTSNSLRMHISRKHKQV